MQNEFFFFLKSNMQIIQIHLLQQVTMPKVSVFPFVSVMGLQLVVHKLSSCKVPQHPRCTRPLVNPY